MENVHDLMETPKDYDELKNLLQKYFKSLDKSLVAFTELKEVSAQNVTSLSNFCEQLDCCRKAKLESSPLKLFDGHRENLINKITASIQDELDSLHETMKEFKSSCNNLQSRSVNIWNKVSQLDIDNKQVVRASPLIPSINDMLMWVDESTSAFRQECIKSEIMLDRIEMNDLQKIEDVKNHWLNLNVLKIQSILGYVQFFIPSKPSEK
ncbi:Uncharacterised protein g10215 [Pycnogonum litorale]